MYFLCTSCALVCVCGWVGGLIRRERVCEWFCVWYAGTGVYIDEVGCDLVDPHRSGDIWGAGTRHSTEQIFWL